MLKSFEVGVGVSCKDNLINGECLLVATDEMLLELQIAPADREVLLLKIEEQKEANLAASTPVSMEQAIAVSRQVLSKYENQLQQILRMKKKLDERGWPDSLTVEYILSALTRQLQETKQEINMYKNSMRPLDEKLYSVNTGAATGLMPKGNASKISPGSNQSPKLSPGSSVSSLSFVSPDAKASGLPPSAVPALTVKQEQILKNAMELYGQKPKKEKGASSGWNFM
ncbi:hypothetical protein HDU91_001675 [Kappamyces sp. JEL0680]|nr:hypothetical protein HDU91_001675 [Kappamyces sp. JEL0680]